MDSSLLSGTVTALPAFGLDGRLTANDLALQAAQPWLAEVVRAELSSGSVDLDTAVNGNPPESLLLEGSTHVSGLELRDMRQDQRLAGLESLGIEKFEFNLADRSLRTSVVNLAGAFGRIHVFEDLSTNIGDLVVDADTTESPGPESRDLDLTIAGIEIEASSLDFTDDSLPLPFTTLIGDLSWQTVAAIQSDYRTHPCGSRGPGQ